MKQLNRVVLTALLLVLVATLVGAPWVMAQGSMYVGLSQVTNDDFIDLYPTVSPNGRFVAYMRYLKLDVGSHFDIFIKEMATGDVSSLQSDQADDAFPTFSYDGTGIYFDAYRRVDVRAVWRQQVGGGTVAKVTNIPKVSFNAHSHPERDVIVFNAFENGKNIKIRKDESFWKQWRKRMPNIMIINADGSNLLDVNKQGLRPRWSPDGQFIVFANNQFGNFEIFSMRADGSDLIRLTTREATDIEPAWSPDGRYIVFASNENKNWNLWMMKPDGTGLAPVTTHEKIEAGPTWGSDGFIYFHSNRNGQWDIWRLKPAGYEPTPPDKDNDGITNFKDKCPDKPEDIDGFQDEDGCPDNDNDNDGVLDEADICPDQLEDMDGFQDQDGCVDPDNDNDGLIDEEDRCPNEAESPNFYQDEDGCPERAPVDKGDLLNVEFGLGSAGIGGANNRAELLRVAAAIRQMPKAKIILKAYTDSPSHRANRRLTDLRASRMVDFLIQQGVPADQIDGMGMGDDDPLTNSATTAGRKQNNRVVVDLAAR